MRIKMRGNKEETARFGAVRLRLAERMADDSLSASDLAAAIGVSSITVRNSASGVTWPSAQLLARLCAHFGCGVGELLVYDPPEQ